MRFVVICLVIVAVLFGGLLNGRYMISAKATSAVLCRFHPSPR
jgi:hypothetical protein